MSADSPNGMSHLSNSARRLLQEFPIPGHVLFNQHQTPGIVIHNQTVPNRLQILEREVQSLARELSEERRHQVELQLQLDALAIQHASTGGALQVSAPGIGDIAKPDTHPRNLVSMLPKTTYKEQDEEEFERSLEYVGVQRKILWTLEKHDTLLTASQAYAWTRASVPKGQHPKPKQALQLCYYMRALGYDTFASIKSTESPSTHIKTCMLRLLVANPHSDMRGVGFDHVYWVQNLHTDEAFPKPYKVLPIVIDQVSRGDVSANALDLGPSFLAELVNEQIQQQQRDSVNLRGGALLAVDTLRLDQDADADVRREAQSAALVEAQADTLFHPSRYVE